MAEVVEQGRSGRAGLAVARAVESAIHGWLHRRSRKRLVIREVSLCGRRDKEAVSSPSLIICSRFSVEIFGDSSEDAPFAVFLSQLRSVVRVRDDAAVGHPFVLGKNCRKRTATGERCHDALLWFAVCTGRNNGSI